MSLRCASLHVVVPPDADQTFQQHVVDVVTGYWLGLGAQHLTSDLFALDRFAAAQTGKLAVAVGPVTVAAATTWRFVSIVDSEQYVANGALGAALARALNTTVLNIAFFGSTDSVTARAYGPLSSLFLQQMGTSWDAVEAFASTMVPQAFVRFADLRTGAAGFVIVGFEGLPLHDDEPF